MVSNHFKSKVCYVQVCHANPSERSRFIRTVYGLLNAPSAAVRYEAAGTLVTLSTAPAAIKVTSVTSGMIDSFMNFICASPAPASAKVTE